MVLKDYLDHRFHSHSQVRMAVIPFSVPANLTANDINQPGAGNEIAWRIQALMLGDGTVPLVEVFNRQDWPAKKEEFFTGNFGAIEMARQAGYDLVLVGYIEPMKSLDSLMLHTKLIEVESGVTVWYGSTETWSRRPEFASIADEIFVRNEKPSDTHIAALLEKAARCTVKFITADNDLVTKRIVPATF